MDDNALSTDGVEYDCPFCLGHFSIGDDDAGPIAVIHSVPPCQTFIELEVTDYVAKVNAKTGRALQ